MEKKISITELAKLAKVSRGTVDRALNNRGGVNPETGKRIQELAEKYDYRPNRISKALASSNVIKVGMITLPETNPFVKKIINAAAKAGNELSDFGFSLDIRSLKELNASEEADLIKSFVDENYSAIIIQGLDSPIVASSINHAEQAGIPVITMNTDVLSCQRRCFVGQGLVKSGQVAADMLCRFMGRKGDIFVMQGSHRISAQRSRLEGFEMVVESDFEDIQIVEIQECLDDDEIAYKKLSEFFRQGRHFDGLYIVAAGKDGAIKALSEFDKNNEISVVGYDISDNTKGHLKTGRIDSVILQDPETQGQLSVKIAFDMLFDGKQPEKQFIETNSSIVTKHTL
jgi:LacI family transcriptional regulator